MNTTISNTTTTDGKTPIGNLIRNMAIGTALAAVAVAVVFVIAEAISGDLLIAGTGDAAPESPPIGFAIGGTIFFGVIATLFATLLRKFASQPGKIFGIVSVVVLIAYGAFAFGAAEDSTTGIWLNVMHVIGAIPLVGAAARSLGATDTPA